MPTIGFGGRRPTSHERMMGLPWDASYTDGPAPWDIGHPQPPIARLASTDAFTGPVLDAGCGTGEHALLIALLGSPVLGVDVAETALEMAPHKARDRGLPAEFAPADALHLERLERSFTTVLDCGLFHTFDADERPAYAASLASVTEHGGTLYVLCFSDESPDTGPHPINQEQLRAAFSPREWMEHRRHRARPDSDEIRRRQRCTGLACVNQADLDCGTFEAGLRV